MDKNVLKKVYDPQDFRERGHQLIDLLANHLEETTQEKSKHAITWNLPENELDFWRRFLAKEEASQLFPEILKHTTHVHHPKYIGHQVSPTAPITALSGMLGALLNNGMAIYEMGMAPSAIERVVIEQLGAKIGYDKNSGGFLTSGGTLANLTALLSARKAGVPDDVWNQGHNDRLGIMVSEEAHYCIDRAAKIMGLGEKGIIKIPVTPNFEIDTTLLPSYLEKAKANGITVFAIIGSAPSTATGIYDDLDTLGQFAADNQLWFHVDGAHGAAAIFSKKYAPMVKGIQRADSIVIDGHKMMMMPTITTALLFKNDRHATATFSQRADYLLTPTDHEDWYNSGKRTFECTKTMMSIHWYVLLKTYGEEIFDAFVTRLYDMGHVFGKMLQGDPQFELAIPPVSNIVCFRYIDAQLDTLALNGLNEKIRQTLLEDGEFYIVQTKLKGVHYLRTTIMNPFTQETHFSQLMKKIRTIAAQSSILD